MARRRQPAGRRRRLAIVVGGGRATRSAQALVTLARQRGLAAAVVASVETWRRARGMATLGDVVLLVGAPRTELSVGLLLGLAEQRGRRPVLVLGGSFGLRLPPAVSRALPPMVRGLVEADLCSSGLFESLSIPLTSSPSIALDAASLLLDPGWHADARLRVAAPPALWPLLADEIPAGLTHERAAAASGRGGPRPAGARARVGRAAKQAAEICLLVGEQTARAAPPAALGRAAETATAAGTLVLPASLASARAACEAIGLARAAACAGGGRCAPRPRVARPCVDREPTEASLLRIGEAADDPHSKLLLRDYGIPVSRQGVAMSPSGAAWLAETIAGPVALRLVAADAPCESEGGLTAGGLLGAPAVRRAYAELAATVAPAPLPGHPLGEPVPMVVREDPEALAALVCAAVPLGAGRALIVAADENRLGHRLQSGKRRAGTPAAAARLGMRAALGPLSRPAATSLARAVLAVATSRARRSMKRGLGDGPGQLPPPFLLAGAPPSLLESGGELVADLGDVLWRLSWLAHDLRQEIAWVLLAPLLLLADRRCLVADARVQVSRHRCLDIAV